MPDLVNVSVIAADVNGVFEEIKTFLENLLENVTIEHIGSTSVEGSITKGDVDVAVIVAQGGIASVRAKLDTCFQHHPKMAPRINFVSYCGYWGGIEFGLQVHERDDPEFNFVEWRDRLRSSHQLLEEYNALKSGCRHLSRAEYTKSKTKFIEECLLPKTDIPQIQRF
jgi:GrpB-like predicted nucleotidyltransferase (UPF0157 family)